MLPRKAEKRHSLPHLVNFWVLNLTKNWNSLKKFPWGRIIQTIIFHSAAFPADHLQISCLLVCNTECHCFFRQKKPPGSPKIVESANEKRRKADDKLAVIFLVIISSFIFCHFPRVAMDVHEIITLVDSNICAENNMPNTFPSWTFVIIFISNFCLVINATLNMYIYCLMSENFRLEVFEVLQGLKCWLK